MNPVHYLSSCLRSTLILSYIFQKVIPPELCVCPLPSTSHALFITSSMIWSPKYETFHEEHKSCSHPLLNFPLLFCSSILGPTILFCLLIITPRLRSLPTTDKLLFLFICSIYMHPKNEHHQHRPKADVSHSFSVPFGVFWNEVETKWW
jgi:hypothetical protein